MTPVDIHITNARVNNLKGVSCGFPQRGLTVVTGPSGSGKSSLAFDTLYAEGKRRYIESMSAYARQFLERIPRPDVDSIEHLLPAIALEQRNTIKNARSTVGTVTEIDDYLRLLMAAIGQVHCRDCGGQVVQGNPQQVAKALKVVSRWYQAGDHRPGTNARLSLATAVTRGVHPGGLQQHSGGLKHPERQPPAPGGVGRRADPECAD
jgi:excinuclease UvrABC ATPase subunit